MTDFETIIVALVEVNKKYPKLRFTQMLQTLNINTFENQGQPLGIKDNFYVSDKIILMKIEKALKNLVE
jgi:hypothetical protein|tara:strand:- start:157 stop:363 length:207 start_codon:yes stop_codon:yes gene_type:complete